MQRACFPNGTTRHGSYKRLLSSKQISKRGTHEGATPRHSDRHFPGRKPPARTCSPSVYGAALKRARSIRVADCYPHSDTHRPQVLGKRAGVEYDCGTSANSRLLVYRRENFRHLDRVSRRRATYSAESIYSSRTKNESCVRRET